MTADRRRKRRVRARAAKTGESYTAALRNLLPTEELRMTTHKISPAGVTDIGHVRAVNEDYLLIEGDVFVVADGMGGAGNGDVASRLAVEVLQEAFAGDPTAAGLVDAVGQANRAIWAEAEATSVRHGMGTTIVAAALIVEDGEDQLVVVNVGDSRAYLLRGEQLTRLTMDHSVVADLVRSGEITDDEAHDHPERHVLTQAVGVAPEVEPHVATERPQPGDRLLLCTDGLFNEVRGDEIESVLTSVTAPAAAVAELITRANAHGGNDNITALVLDISR